MLRQSLEVEFINNEKQTLSFKIIYFGSTFLIFIDSGTLPYFSMIYKVHGTMTF